MLQEKNIISINGPVIKARGDGDFAMNDMVYVGEDKILGEVIKLNQDTATIQVYESSTGLKIGEKVEGSGEPLSLILGPGMIGNIFDGIQRPLVDLKEKTGDFLKRGVTSLGVDLNKKWRFYPCCEVGTEVSRGFIIGTVNETQLITNKIMIPFDINGKITKILPEAEYTPDTVLAEVEDEQGKVYQITMIQKWAAKTPRPYKKRITIKEPLITGQRVVDTMFPIAKGGTAMLPGGFGTGKTMLQHQLAKWSNADIIVYIGCGERGNEMTEVLEDFPRLMDPNTGRPLIERTVLIANTSNMPVAAREASIYTGITIAEYYRDMGYNVAIMADSTSRWAEALREISGRLEEMPAEEGFPSYLPSKLSQFYGRAGLVESFSGKLGSVTIIGAVSPQGSDFSEPVTQNTKRFIHTFWGLKRDLAYSRHYPAVDWNISYSEYLSDLQTWYEENVDLEFWNIRSKAVRLLEEENELLEISRVVGQDVLSDSRKLILEIASAIRIGFLQQSALNEIDTAIPIKKQFLMLKSVILMYERGLKIIEKGIPISAIKKTGLFEEYKRLKFEIDNTHLENFDDFELRIKTEFKKIEEEYKNHI